MLSYGSNNGIAKSQCGWRWARSRGDIRNQFLSLAFRMLAYGVVLGGVGAWLSGRAMQTLLFHVPAFNLGILGGAAAVMGMCDCCVPGSLLSSRADVASLKPCGAQLICLAIITDRTSWLR